MTNAKRRIVEHPEMLVETQIHSRRAVTTINSVLIVDDEPSVRDLMSLWVTSMGLRVATASTADQALTTLRDGAYDLAVVDVLMPGHDGLWLAAEMQRDYPHTAVIIATAFTELLGPDAPQPDIADLLIKPFQRDRFALALERARQWRKQALEEKQWHAVLAKELRERTEELCVQVGAAAGPSAAADWLIAVMADRAPAVLEHGGRVARYSAAVAHEMSFGSGAIDEIKLAAQFHDVGKAAMPDGLLTKPSLLSRGEKVIMRGHVEAGAEILGSAPALASIAPIVMATHERFDGKGYPRQHAGAAIPLPSRIISVVDAYDTMTDLRADRISPWPAGVVSELLRCAGTQFDPDALTAFLAVLGRH
jgi:putative nucleotidyltransferase with HDIG domain